MKIAVFVEGLTEDIFIEALLENYFSTGKIEISRVKHQGHTKAIYYRSLEQQGQYGEHFCLIVNVGSDEAVLSKLREEYQNMRKKGYSAFFGLRDLKSEQYDRFGEDFIRKTQEIVDGFGVEDNVYFHFAKMEIEAWLLAAPGFLTRVNPSLTIEYVQSISGIDLDVTDPEISIENPAAMIGRIFRAVGLRYRKRKSEIHGIVSKVNWDELCLDAREQGKVSYFFRFLDDLDAVIP